MNSRLTGPDARHVHEGWVLADAEEGAGQREEPQGAHDPLRHAAQGEADLYFECTEMRHLVTKPTYWYRADFPGVN